MSPTRMIIGAVTVAFLVASPSGFERLIGPASSGAALAAGSIDISVKIVSNNNRTFSLNVPSHTEVNCSDGSVDLIFELVGSPGAHFPDDSGRGIKVINGAGTFESPRPSGNRTIIVTDLCTELGEFKYDVGVVDPNGVFVLLDPVIKNY